MMEIRKKRLIIGVVGTGLVIGGVVFVGVRMKYDQVMIASPSSESEISIVSDQSVSGSSFPEITVTKKSVAENRFAYDFISQDKVIGTVSLNNDWVAERSLSYANGNEYFGFSLEGSGTAGKEYWGPSILYRANVAQSSIEKVADLSQEDAIKNGQETTLNSWGSDFFITDLSEDETDLIYCNFWSDTNKVFLKDLISGEEKVFFIDSSVSDFGDAVLSSDKKTIAVAGIKRNPTDDGSMGAFIEADIFLIDVASGQVRVYQASKNPGFYELNGWNQNQSVDFSYTEEIGE